MAPDVAIGSLGVAPAKAQIQADRGREFYDILELSKDMAIRNSLTDQPLNIALNLSFLTMNGSGIKKAATSSLLNFCCTHHCAGVKATRSANGHCLVDKLHSWSMTQTGHYNA